MSLANRLLQPPYIYIEAFALGLSIATGIWYYYEYKPAILSFAYTPPPIVHTSAEAPTHIAIPKAGVSLAIEPGYVRKDVWTISDHFASHLASSGRPGEDGNIVIYGHDKPSIFGSLHLLSRGDEVVLKTKDQEFTYIVMNSFETTPTNVSVLEPQESEVLTLFTCTGPFDSKRLVIQATPKQNQL